jgi:hypothetical protein
MKVIASATTTQPSVIHKGYGQQKKYLLGGLLLGLSLSMLTTGKAQAANFTFTEIADTSSLFKNFNSGAGGRSIAINDSGTVAFYASLNLGDSSQNDGIFTGDGGALTTTIVSRNVSGGGIFEVYDKPDINNAGTVVFISENYPNAGVEVFKDGAVIGGIGIGNRNEYGAPAINNSGTIVVGEETDESPFYFILVNGTVDEITSFPLLEPAINNIGDIVFAVSQGGLPVPMPLNGTYIQKSDGEIIPISSDLILSPVINDNDTVAFVDNGGVFTDSNEVTTTIADTSGFFSSFGSVAINNSGEVAFLANLKSGGQGIFIGSDPVTDEVIGIGDSLFGSTVTAISFSDRGLNNSGQIAFVATLANGTEGVFRANPVIAQSVPEPGSVLGLLAVGALSAGALGKRHKKQQP